MARSKQEPLGADEVSAEQREAAEQRRRRRKKPRTRRRLIILGVVALLVAVVWLNWDTLNPASVWNWLTVTVTGGETGDGYPLQIEGSTVTSMRPCGRYLAVLTHNSLNVYNRTAGTVLSRTHNFANPLLDTAGGHILIAELGGRRVRITTVDGKMKEWQVAQNIVDASLANDGSFAVVTGSDKSHISEIVYYNKNGKEKLHWYSSEALILGVDLRDDGRQMAAIGTMTDNGVTSSRLLLFDIASGKEPTVHKGKGVMLCTVEYLPGGHVAAVGDTEVWVAQGKKDPTVRSYEDMQMIGYAVSGKQVSVALRSYGAASGGQLLTLDQNGKEVYNKSFTGDFRDLAADDRGFLLLTESTLQAFNQRGDVKTAEVSSDGLLVCRVFGDDVVLGLTSLSTYKPGA